MPRRDIYYILDISRLGRRNGGSDRPLFLYSAQIQAQQGKIYYLLSVVYIQHKKMLMLMSETNQVQLVLIQNQQVLIQNLELANQGSAR